MDGYVIVTMAVHRYVTLWDFDGSGTEELSFKAGDLFQAVDKTGDWWLVDRINAVGGKTGERGYVPFNYLVEEGTVEEKKWFFGELSRTEAIKLLMKGGNTTGSFLVRQSDKQDFVYALSVRNDNSVKHFKILRDSGGDYHLNTSAYFPDLSKLVDYYHEKPVMKGLVLTKPCLKDLPFFCLGVLTHCSLDEPTAIDLNPLPLDEWERPKEEFILGKKLGSGNFAQVHEGYWKGRVKIKVAIKTIKQDMTNREIFQKETAFLKTLRHRNLLSLYAVCSVGDPYYIVTELLAKGDLLHFLRDDDEGKELNLEGLMDIAGQVTDGMHYLESKNCIHRDLAARNVLIGHNNICKVADFGLARIIPDDFYMSRSKEVPYKWTAPEALEFGRFTLKSDVWSFGVLLHEIMSRGSNPYPGIPNSELLQHLKKGRRLSIPENCSEKIHKVMLECWNANPQKRPTFGELKITIDNLANYEPSSVEPPPKPIKPKGLLAKLKKNAQ